MGRTKIGFQGLLYVVVSLVILVATIGLVSNEIGEEKDKVDILFLGDSLIGQYRDETSVPYLVGQALGKTTFNGAFGGSTLTWYPSTVSDYYYRYGLNFPALTRSISVGDFGVQNSFEVRELGAEDFETVLECLKKLDYESLEMIIIEYGTNDYFAGAHHTEGDERYDVTTFEGSLRSGLEELQKSFPNCNLVIVGPTYNWYYTTNESCEEVEFGGGYLKGYVESLKEIAEEYGILFIDLYELYSEAVTIGDSLTYTIEGIHPNEYGRRMMAEEIVGQLRELGYY